jgi:starch synthase
MKALICASEGAPFAKTGGLADVIGALPKALKENGCDARVIMPFYKRIKDQNTSYYLGYAYVRLGQRMEYVGIFHEERDGIDFYFVDNDKYFYREGLYGYNDDGERFAFFNFAVLEALKVIGFFPDIIHCNDWQTGLLPYILKCNYWQYPEYNRIKTVFSIHNIQYQGIFP